MRRVAKISPIEVTQTGHEAANILEKLDTGWGCISYGKPLPKFKKMRYVAPSEGWQHDHCEFCWSEFFEEDDGGLGTLGWSIDDPGQHVPMKLDKDDPQNQTHISGSPDNVRCWACLLCKDIISRWETGSLKVAIIRYEEIPGNL